MELLLASWLDVDPCGLWGVCLNIGLDLEEEELVRQQVKHHKLPGIDYCGSSLNFSMQALFVLVNQSAVYNRHKKWDHCLTHTTTEVGVVPYPHSLSVNITKSSLSKVY